MSLLSSPSLSIKLTEPFIFVTAPARPEQLRRTIEAGGGGPVLVRGLLILKLPKATKITGIDVVLDGRSITDWPEGIGPRRLDVTEQIPLVHLTTSFFDPGSTDRRALSLGPGIRYEDHEPPEDADLHSRYPQRSTTPTGHHRPPQYHHEPMSTLTNDRREGSPTRAPAPPAGGRSEGFPARAASAHPTSRFHSSGQYVSSSIVAPSRDEIPPYSPPSRAYQLPSTISVPVTPVNATLGQPSSFAHHLPVRSFENVQTPSSSSLADSASLSSWPDRERGRRPHRDRDAEADSIDTSSSRRFLPEDGDRFDLGDLEGRRARPGGAAIELLSDGIDPEDHPILPIPEDIEGAASGPGPSNDPHTASSRNEQLYERDVSVDVYSSPTTAPPSATGSRHDLPNESALLTGIHQQMMPALSRPSSASSAPPTSLSAQAQLAAQLSGVPIRPSLTTDFASGTSTVSAPASADRGSPSPTPTAESTSSLSRLSTNVSHTAPPTPFSAVPPPLTPRREASRERGRGGSHSRSRSRFSHGIAAVTHLLREVGHDVRDAVTGASVGSHHDASPSPSRGRLVVVQREASTSSPSPPAGARTRAQGSASPMRGASVLGATTGVPRATSADIGARVGSLSVVNGEREVALSHSDERFIGAVGRGGVGAQSLDRDGRSASSRSRDRDTPRGRTTTRNNAIDSLSPLHQSADGEDEGEDEVNARRGRDATINPLGDMARTQQTRRDAWKEFRKGTYTYPISFAIPHDLPPSLSCDYGSVSYRLMATVHRAGTFAPKVTATQPLTLVSCLGPEATDDLDNIMVQRQWDDQLEYNLHVEGTAFPIGGTIPINITLLPLDKVSIYRITIGLDEKIDYYAHGRKVARHEPPRFYELVQVREPVKEIRLLPIFSESPNAGQNSPLKPFVHPDEGDLTFDVIPPSASTAILERTSDVASHLLAPAGPWRLRFEAKLPGCDSNMRFTNKYPGSRIPIVHKLKIALRVSKGVASEKDSKDKLKLFDIIIETPIHILSCRCKTSFTHLPTYSQLIETAAESANQPTHPRVKHQEPHARRGTALLVPAYGSSIAASGYARSQANSTDSPTLMSFLPGSTSVIARPGVERDGEGSTSRGRAATAEAMATNEQFARLMAGQESEEGETPPMYSSLS